MLGRGRKVLSPRESEPVLAYGRVAASVQDAAFDGVVRVRLSG